MSDHQRNQQQQQQQVPKGWVRASPMRGPGPPTRLMSPATVGGVPRQRSPTPTFNARQLVGESSSTFNPQPQQQSPTPPLRRMPQQPTGFTTVYDSSRFTPVRAPSEQPTFKPVVPMSPINFPPPPDLSMPRPFRSTFSPIPSNAPTPSSIPAFSPQPAPQPQYMYMDKNRNIHPASDVYVVPLEPTTLPRDITVHDPESDGRLSTAEIIAQQSQEYVDEKLAEYQATISLLQGEFMRQLIEETRTQNKIIRLLSDSPPQHLSRHKKDLFSTTSEFYKR